MTREPDEQDSRAEVFEAIGHPTRIKILQVLHDEPMGFAALKRAVGVESSGNLSFHLTKLKDLVKTAPDGNYVLSDDGKEALWSVSNISGTRSDSGPGLHITRTGRTQRRVLVSLLVVALLVLGSVEVLQQNQLAMEQAEISSQQAQFGLYVNQARPFTSGQAASIVLGQGDFSSGFPLEPATSRGTMDNPTQALLDSSGNLWVVDSLNIRVLEFKPPFTSGMEASLVIGQKNFSASISSTSKDGFGRGIDWYGAIGPNGAAFDHSGNLWVADSANDRIVEFKPSFTTGMSASLVIGHTVAEPGNYYSVEKPSRDGLNLPTKPVFDPYGNLWVVDSYDNRVLEFEPPFSDGMNASLVIGQKNFETLNPSASQSGLQCWRGDLAFDSSGNLWVGDSVNNRILEFQPPFSIGMNASLVIGQPDFTTNDVSRSLGRWGFAPNPFGPVAIIFDRGGNLWTTFTDRLIEFSPPFSSGMQASLEIGQPDFTSLAWKGGQNGLLGPSIPAFDSSGNLWVPDSGNNRVLEFVSAYPGSGGSPPEQSPQLIGLTPLVIISGALVALTLTSYFVLRRTRFGGLLERFPGREKKTALLGGGAPATRRKT